MVILYLLNGGRTSLKRPAPFVQEGWKRQGQEASLCPASPHHLLDMVEMAWLL